MSEQIEIESLANNNESERRSLLPNDGSVGVGILSLVDVALVMKYGEKLPVTGVFIAGALASLGGVASISGIVRHYSN